MKTCTKCSLEKCLSLFSRQAKGKFCVTSICKSCASERGKAWHAANREHSLRLKTEYRIAHADKAAEASRKWWEENRARAFDCLRTTVTSKGFHHLSLELQ